MSASDPCPVACGDCIFWVGVHEAGDDPRDLPAAGECHRRAPLPVISPDGPGVPMPDVRWPMVAYDDFCGEGRERRLSPVSPRPPKGASTGASR